MRIQVERDGGFAYFPGLSGPTTIDTDALSANEAAALEAAVERADFSTEAALAAAPAPGSADHRTVTITVEETGSARSVTVAEPIADASLRALVDRVLTTAERARPA
jgi:hypothetical protein